MKTKAWLAVVLGLVLVSGCRSAYYSTMEKFGVYKRDLLKKRVIAARDDQKAASEQFKDALTRMKEMYNFQGGDLEKTYDTFKRDFDRSVERADSARKRIRDMETLASDLFAEWEGEIKQMSTASLRDSSTQKLRDTKQRYEEMHSALVRAEKSMDPVLTRFKDQVLYLKHNLNAAAIASLKGESTSIQNDISSLLQDMNRAISQADQFINTIQ